ncbi:MAG TPA: ABC transporter permease subunit [Roseateles sp.]|nr:ABC transporter permease subunit [Roseateles sp.]
MSAVLSPSSSGVGIAGALAPAAVPASAPVSARPWGLGLLAALVWGATAALTYHWPNAASGFTDWPYTAEAGQVFAAVAVLLLALALLGPYAGRPGAALLRRLRPAGAWIVAIGLGLGAWELLTAKLGRLPTPFFAPPTALAEVYLDDWRRLGESGWNSVRLLTYGVAWGAATGFLVGVAIGWSRAIGYWVHPVIRFLGPVPASALLPLAFFAFPSSYAAAVFLIALATGFPVAVLTWSGVASVNRNYYDVARTLGASQAFLVLRVAIPAALPQVFVGLFMGLGGAFSILVTAEMMGVKSGLGWYLTWAQGWAAYGNMYAALILMAILCSGLITLLFLLRDRVLSWQKGTVKW